MARTYVECLFNLENGNTHKLTIKDVKSNIQISEIEAMADLLIEKESHHNQSLFSSLKKCTKYTVDEELLISND